MFATKFTPQLDSDDADLHNEILASVQRALAEGDWSQYRSRTVDALRDEIAGQLGVETVRLCSSGSAAIELALRACHLREGDEVICPALDYPGNLRAIRLLGASPVIVDSAAGRWTIDVAQVETAGSAHTRAVVVSHLYGEIADVQRLRALCDERGWTLIEDVCQMPGAVSDGRPLGSFGHVAAFSFGGSKPLTAGCGGAVATNDQRIRQRMATYSDRPSDAFPVSPLQAAALLPQWRRLERLVQRQQASLAALIAACKDQTPNWQWPSVADEARTRSSYYKVPIEATGSSGQKDEYLARLSGSLLHADICVGAPFRVHTKVMQGRGRLVSFQNAAQLVARTFLLDHRHLLGTSDTLISLAAKLIAAHDTSE
ncbi:MAG: DegT/DnrJ/EryC1/StrS family aminotransferase [Planctomycetaceae bacterium]